MVGCIFWRIGFLVVFDCINFLHSKQFLNSAKTRKTPKKPFETHEENPQTPPKPPNYSKTPPKPSKSPPDPLLTSQVFLGQSEGLSFGGNRLGHEVVLVHGSHPLTDRRASLRYLVSWVSGWVFGLVGGCLVWWVGVWVGGWVFGLVGGCLGWWVGVWVGG